MSDNSEIPKAKRHRDMAALAAARARRACERCGKAGATEGHHALAHAGKISKGDLRAIVAGRKT